MNEDTINYSTLIDDAMHTIVKKALEIAIDHGLPGDHHFFISFMTNYPGVQISPKLAKKYTVDTEWEAEVVLNSNFGFYVTEFYDSNFCAIEIYFQL